MGKLRHGVWAITIVQLIGTACSLKVMELMAPYKIMSMANGRFLTASHQGILGLKTGKVTTEPYFQRKEQQWTLTWDPSVDDSYDGYRMESRTEYLNQVTTFYPDGSTRAMPNIWEIVELRNGARMFRNKRTMRCLQVLKSKPDVVEKSCSIQNRFQHWHLSLLDLDKRVGLEGELGGGSSGGEGRRRAFLVRHMIPVEVDEDDENIELDNSEESVEDDTDY